MGRLMDGMTRLVGEIHAVRDDRGCLMRELTRATVEMRCAVARLRSSFAASGIVRKSFFSGMVGSP